MTGFCFTAATLASLAAGTSFMASSIEGAQKERVSQSPEAKQNFEAQQRLQAEISAMAISPATVANAKRELLRLNELWERAYAKNSAYMTRDYTPKDRWFKRTARAIKEDMTPIDNAIAIQKRILQRAEDYQAKISLLDQVRNEAPNIADGAGELAGFVSLGSFAGIPAPRVRVEVLTWTTIFSELIAGIGWLAYGMLKTRRRFTPYELALAQRQSHHEQRFVAETFKHSSSQLSLSLKNDLTESPITHETEGGNADAFSDNFSVTESNTGEAIEAAASHEKHADDAVGQVEVLPIPKDGKRRVGGMYPCAQCSATYAARTTWHKYCRECRKHNVKDSIARGKS